MTPEPETVEGWSAAHDNTVRGNLRNGVKVARTELLRSYRQFVDDRRSLIVFGVALVVLLPVIYGSLSAVHDLGSDIAAQSQDVAGSRGEGTGITRPGGFGTGLGLTPGRLSLFDILKQQTTLLVFFLAGLFTLRTVERLAEVDNKDLLLTNTPTRSIVVGVVSAEILRNLSFFGVVLAVYSTAFALGLGTPSTALTVVLGFVPLLGFTVLVGFTLGLVLKFVVLKVPGATYLRYVAVVGLALGFYLTGGFRGFRLTSPLNSYADILFVTSPIGVSVGATELGVLVAILASFPVLVGASTRVASHLWYADPSEDDVSVAVSRRPPGVLSETRTRRISWRLWLRGFRSPRRFVHFIYLGLLLLPALFIFIDRPSTIPLLTSPLLVVVGGWLSGAAFGLNPLGDEGSMLDTLLTTPVDGEEFVRARMLSGLILGVPVVVVGNFIAEPFNPFSPLTSLVVTVFGVLLCLYTAALGVGIGSFAPRFQPVRSRTFDDVEVVRPTIVALLGYTFVSLLAAVLGLLVFGFPEVLGLLPYVGDLPTLWVRVGGAAVLVAVLGVVGYRSYVYAVERFNRYTV